MRDNEVKIGWLTGWIYNVSPQVANVDSSCYRGSKLRYGKSVRYDGIQEDSSSPYKPPSPRRSSRRILLLLSILSRSSEGSGNSKMKKC